MVNPHPPAFMNAASVYHEYLHTEYRTRSRSTAPFDATASTLWWQWASWSDNRDPWGIDELRLVITWLRLEIKEGRRHPGCLEFSHLIGRPDQFESYLAQARHWLRLRRARRPRLVPPLRAFRNH